MRLHPVQNKSFLKKYLLIYLKNKVTEAHREREIFHLLLHSQNGHGWIRLELGAQGFLWVFHVRAAPFAVFPGTLTRSSAGLEVEQLGHEPVHRSGYRTAGGSIIIYATTLVPPACFPIAILLIIFLLLNTQTLALQDLLCAQSS